MIDGGRAVFYFQFWGVPSQNGTCAPPPTGYTIGFLAVLFDNLLVLRKNLFYDGIHKLCFKNI